MIYLFWVAVSYLSCDRVVEYGRGGHVIGSRPGVLMTDYETDEIGTGGVAQVVGGIM